MVWKEESLFLIADEIKNKGEIGKLPYIEIGDINLEHKDYVYKNKKSIKGSKKANKGDIIISKVRPTRGAISIIKEDELNVSNAFCILRIKGAIIPKYLCYILNQKSFLDYLGSKEKGTMYPSCKSEDILNYKIKFPESKQEQHSIVQEIEKQFTRLDEAVKSLKVVKEKIEVYREAVLKDIFYGENKKFSEIISKEKYSMKRGPFGGSLKKEIFVPKGYKVYEQKNAIKNNFDIGSYFITPEKFKEMEAFSINPGDLIISCSGTIGRIAEVPKNAQEGIINQALLKITLDNKKILKDYFIYLFESPYIQRYLIKVSRGVAIKNVPSVKEMKEIDFPVPSLQDQQKIVQEIESKFSVIDKVEETVNQALIKTEQLRKSILKIAFEGKLIKEIEK